eukprot:428152_1
MASQPPPYNANYTQNMQPSNGEQQPLQQIVYVDQHGNPINPPPQQTQVIQVVQQPQQQQTQTVVVPPQTSPGQTSTETKPNATDINVGTFCNLPWNPQGNKCCKVWCVAANSLILSLLGFIMLIAGFNSVIDPSPTCSGEDVYDCDGSWSDICDSYGCSECYQYSSSLYGGGCTSYEGDTTTGGIVLTVFGVLLLLFGLWFFWMMKKRYEALKSGESTLPTQT